jgi:hypothetical protein
MNPRLACIEPFRDRWEVREVDGAAVKVPLFMYNELDVAAVRFEGDLLVASNASGHEARYLLPLGQMIGMSCSGDVVDIRHGLMIFKVAD